MSLTALHAALLATDLLREPEVENGFVHGPATFAAAGAELVVNVDPDPEDEGRAVDPAGMVERTRALLGLDAEAYARIVGEVADELDAALEEEGLARVVDLRADLTPAALIVLPEGSAVVLLSPLQLGDGEILVFLDDEHEIQDIHLQGAHGGCGDDCACGTEVDGETLTTVEDLIATRDAQG